MRKPHISDGLELFPKFMWPMMWPVLGINLLSMFVYWVYKKTHKPNIHWRYGNMDLFDK